MLCGQSKREDCYPGSSARSFDEPSERDGQGSEDRMNTDEVEQNQLQLIVYTILRNSDTLRLESRTKFLAYSLLLKFVKKFPCFLNQNQQLLIISCLHLAVKFSESAEVSNAYTLECCVVQAQGIYSTEDFVEMELQIIQVLEYKLYTLTPYDYLDELALKLKLDDKKREIIQAAIDYMLSLVWTPDLTAEQIFTCCFLACYEGVNIQHMNLFTSLDRMYKKFPNIRSKVLLIREEIFKRDEDDSELVSAPF